MTTLIDTNIIFSLLDDGDKFHSSCTEAICKLRKVGPLLVTDIVYCEASVGMDTVEDIDSALSTLALERVSTTNEALFLAGKAFLRYKTLNSGPKTNVLPDFIIGATAKALDLPLLTRNSSDFNGYFPDIKIIEPQDKT